MHSNVDILKAVKSKNLEIKPFKEKNLRTDSYKVHLDSIISVPRKGLIDTTETENYEMFYTEKKTEKHVLKPGNFILGRTLESFSIPIDLTGFISGKSGLARLGISVVQTAPFIHAGHGVPKPRKIILEILNAGPFDVMLREKMPIGEIAFFRLNSPTSNPYDHFGKYGKRKEKNAFTPLKE